MANRNTQEIIYKDLSYQIVGAAFAVFNELGYGMPEKYYQRAFEAELQRLGIPYEREKLIVLNYKGISLGRYFVDFMVDGKVVVELKVRPRLGYVHLRQVSEYLSKLNKKLAIIIYFSKDGVHYRRVLNSKFKEPD